jgi:hypothetical protein
MPLDYKECVGVGAMMLGTELTSASEHPSSRDVVDSFSLFFSRAVSTRSTATFLPSSFLSSTRLVLSSPTTPIDTTNEYAFKAEDSLDQDADLARCIYMRFGESLFGTIKEETKWD